MPEPFYYKFDFSLTIKEVESFCIYHAKRSPYRKHWYMLIWLSVPPLIVVLWAFSNNTINDVGWLLAGLIAMYLIWVLISPIYALFHNLIVKEMIKSKLSQYAVDVPQTLIIDNGQIINCVNSTEIVLQWNAIEYILSDVDHFYFYLCSRKAVIIPKRLFKDKADSDAFIQKVKGAHDRFKEVKSC